MLDSGQCVAPFAGAWIEIFAISYAFFTVSSLPSRERGLKLRCLYKIIRSYTVAPFAGAWIEIKILTLWTIPLIRRSLRGSVD